MGVDSQVECDRAAPAVERSLEYCEAVVRAQARNFWFGLCLTPRPRRDALYALYAWMREADDLVDEPGATLERFEAFVHQSRRVISGVATGAEIRAMGGGWPAFAWMVRHFGIKSQWLEDMLAGLGGDFSHRSFESCEEFSRYCYRVAGTVGMCCTSIWGVRAGRDRAEALRAADHRGRAFQLINVLRDVGTDARHACGPRVYIPRCRLAKHALNGDDLVAWRHPERCVALVHDLGREAMHEMRLSSSLGESISPDCERVLGAMTEIYTRILSMVQDEPRRCLDAPPASLSTRRKLTIAATWALRAYVAEYHDFRRAGRP